MPSIAVVAARITGVAIAAAALTLAISPRHSSAQSSSETEIVLVAFTYCPVGTRALNQKVPLPGLRYCLVEDQSLFDDLTPIWGSLILMAAPFCPQRTLPADGRLMNIQQNTALFSLLRTRYGGDGRSTFALPNMGMVAQGRPRYCVVTQGIYPRRP